MDNVILYVETNGFLTAKKEVAEETVTDDSALARAISASTQNNSTTN